MTWQPTYLTCAVVLAVDALLKLTIPTPVLAQHHRPAWTAIIALAAALLLVTTPFRFGGISVGLLAGGMFANGLDLVDGLGQNPLVIALGSGEAVSFNFADLAVILGSVLFVDQLVRVWLRRRAA